jgi:glycosyltransferase involved in cell wall biosynthesis
VDTSGLPLDDQVNLTGWLSDIRPRIAQSWVSVVPLRIGAGTRLKILESLALGTPVVSTTRGAEGLQLSAGRDTIADTPLRLRPLDILEDNKRLQLTT